MSRRQKIWCKHKEQEDAKLVYTLLMCKLVNSLNSGLSDSDPKTYSCHRDIDPLTIFTIVIPILVKNCHTLLGNKSKL